MGCINIREGDAVVSIIKLDSCGTQVIGAGGALVLNTISEFSYEEQIQEGDEVTEKNFGGRKIASDVGCDELTSIAVSLTALGLNPVMDSLLLGSTLKTVDTTVSGFGRKDLVCAQNVAIEVLMKLDTDACSGSGAAPVAGWLFPLVKNWKPTGGLTLNGNDFVKPPYAGKGFTNPLLFGTGGSPVSSTALEKWETVITDNEWFAFHVFDGATTTLPTASCDPVALVAA